MCDSESSSFRDLQRAATHSFWVILNLCIRAESPFLIPDTSKVKRILCHKIIFYRRDTASPEPRGFNWKLTEVWDVSASLNVLFPLASIKTLKPRLINLKKTKNKAIVCCLRELTGRKKKWQNSARDPSIQLLNEKLDNFNPKIYQK